MHLKGLLHKMLSPVMHQKRLSTFTLLVETVLRTKRLSLTELGIGLRLPIQERSGIRRVDRFLGNENLYAERKEMARVIIEKAIGTQVNPDIMVDWSQSPNSDLYILRASLAAKGRAISLYEEVHAQKYLGNEKVQHRFLETLKSLLHKECKPVILTDGGFHNEWFRQVVALGYHYIGRIRAGSGKKYFQEATKGWVYCADLMKTATPTPRSLGEVNLCKHRPIKTHLFLFKGKSKGRTALNRSGEKRRGGSDLEYRRTAKEPWLLASSLTGNSLMAKRVVKKYAYRMQIEEGFRDLKSSSYGFCFENAYSKQPARVEVLLLIAMFASFIAWVIGWIGEQTGLHVQFQSNTRKQRVLSFFYLGCQMIRRKIKINLTQWNTAIAHGITV